MSENNKNLWIVIIGEPFYPSVIHFNNKREASEYFEAVKGDGCYAHMAKVELTHIDEPDYIESRGDMDIHW